MVAICNRNVYHFIVANVWPLLVKHALENGQATKWPPSLPSHDLALHAIPIDLSPLFKFGDTRNTTVEPGTPMVNFILSYGSTPGAPLENHGLSRMSSQLSQRSCNNSIICRVYWISLKTKSDLRAENNSPSACQTSVTCLTAWRKEKRSTSKAAYSQTSSRLEEPTWQKPDVLNCQLKIKIYGLKSHFYVAPQARYGLIFFFSAVIAPSASFNL